jgi:acyl carrier protein
VEAIDEVRGDVLSEVVRALVEVVGDDFLLEVEVGPETTLNGALALESIEFVALAERLRGRYGSVVDPVALAGGMDLNEIIGMTVGDLVEHIESRLGSSARAESLQSPAEV